MLRIAKSTPGVLDLSAVKDEHGIPVTLIGPSHRDVPDHEEDNPILQRIAELGWVTVSRVPVGTSDETPPTEPALCDLAPSSTGMSDSETGAANTSSVPDVGVTELSTDLAPTTDVIPPEGETGNGASDVQSPALDAGIEQPSGELTPEVPARSEGAGRPAGRSDSRRAGRRS